MANVIRFDMYHMRWLVRKICNNSDWLEPSDSHLYCLHAFTPELVDIMICTKSSCDSRCILKVGEASLLIVISW